MTTVHEPIEAKLDEARRRLRTMTKALQKALPAVREIESGDEEWTETLKTVEQTLRDVGLKEQREVVVELRVAVDGNWPPGEVPTLDSLALLVAERAGDRGISVDEISNSYTVTVDGEPVPRVLRPFVGWTAQNVQWMVDAIQNAVENHIECNCDKGDGCVGTCNRAECWRVLTTMRHGITISSSRKGDAA